MPIFALPLNSAIKARTSRINHANLGVRKRKRKRANSNSSDEDLYNNSDDEFLAASTNPLSLTPNDIAQYKLAGLSLNEELPGQKGLKDWPHRGLERERDFFASPTELPADDKKGKGIAGDEIPVEENNNDQTEKKQRFPAGPRLRLQHLSVLTAIVHRCLLEGDIPRATRAFSLLIRAEPGGKMFDIKSTGYWGIGAELLVRSQDRGISNKFNFIKEAGLDPKYMDEETRREEQVTDDVGNMPKKIWGSKDGFEKAKSYYETLILQYPYTKQFKNYTNPLDFWAAMAACEIYGIQSEQQEALRKMSELEKKEVDHSDVSRDSEDDVYADAPSDFGASSTPPQLSSRRQREYDKIQDRWTAKDLIRLTALAASESLGKRMDETLNRMPFNQSSVLWRLRGMLALYIADLNVPDLPTELDDEDNEGDDDEEVENEAQERDRRFLYKQRTREHEKGKNVRKGLWDKAKVFFNRCATVTDFKEEINIVDPDDDEVKEDDAMEDIDDEYGF